MSTTKTKEGVRRGFSGLFGVMFLACGFALFACTVMNGLTVGGDGGASSSSGGSSGSSGGKDGGKEGGGSSSGEGGLSSGGPCDPDAPFVRFFPISELNTVNDEGLPRLSSDENTIYFYDDHFDGGATIYSATRPDLDTPFGARTALFPDLIGARTPALSPDNLQMYFSISNAAFSLDNWGLRVSGRSMTNEAFQASVILRYPQNENESFSTPYVVEAGGKKRVYYANFTTSAEIWTAEIDTSGAMVNEQPVLNVNSTAADYDQLVTPDGLYMYFYSDREKADHGRVYVSKRASLEENFGVPVVVESIPRPPNGWISPGWLSADNCRLYYYEAVQFDMAADLGVAVRDPK